MGNKSWKWFVFASILAAALWAAGSSEADEKKQPKAFNSTVAFGVWAVTGEEAQKAVATCEAAADFWCKY